MACYSFRGGCAGESGGSVTCEAAPGTGRCVSGSCLRDRQQLLVAQLGREQELRPGRDLLERPAARRSSLLYLP